MEVLKQTSPQAEAVAPKPGPRKTEPSSRARIAFMNSRYRKRVGHEVTKARNFQALASRVGSVGWRIAAALRTQPLVIISSRFNNTLATTVHAANSERSAPACGALPNCEVAIFSAAL